MSTSPHPTSPVLPQGRRDALVAGLFARRNLAAAAVSLGLLIGATACGSDDDDSLPAAACDAVAALDGAMAMAPQDPAGFGPFVQDSLMPPLMTLMSELDGEPQDAAERMHRTLEGVVQSGDPSAMHSPETFAAQAVIGEAVHEGCDLQAVAIVAKEYAFEGAPDTLAAGRASFALTNEGVEEHEMVLFRAADGVTEPLEELLQLPEEQVMSKMQFTGVTFGGPDTTGYVTVDLTPGTGFVLPAGTRHRADVGPDGCTCLEGHRG